MAQQKVRSWFLKTHSLKKVKQKNHETHARNLGLTERARYLRVLVTIREQFRIEAFGQAHSTAREPNGVRGNSPEINGPGSCQRLTEQASNCHQANASVRWPHSDLSHQRAISYPTRKRYPGLNAALQPDLLRHRSTALPTWASPTKH